MEYLGSISTKIGIIKINQENEFITKLDINTLEKPLNSQEQTPLIKYTITQLDEYFNNKRRKFDLPIKPKGTRFQLKVWNELMKISYGKTQTYKQIAQNIGLPKAYRAVGNANHKNPIPIIIPCHRVIGSNGNLLGYASGVNIKNFLINLESHL